MLCFSLIPNRALSDDFRGKRVHRNLMSCEKAIRLLKRHLIRLYLRRDMTARARSCWIRIFGIVIAAITGIFDRPLGREAHRSRRRGRTDDSLRQRSRRCGRADGSRRKTPKWHPATRARSNTPALRPRY
jgi:hypothetical protein